MNKETENYIKLKPISERFSRISNEISDDEIKRLIKDAMISKIEDAISFDALGDVINDYLEEHSDEINHAIMDSLLKRLDLPKGYKLY